MHEHLTEEKVSIVAFFTAITSILGWKGVMLVVWLLVMALDYISGTVAAIKNHNWSSEEARAGLWHKTGMVLTVMVAAIADLVLFLITSHIPELGIVWPVLVMPLVVSWHIVTELGSILENAVKLGAPVPSWLIKILKGAGKAMDAAGEKAAEEVAPEKEEE